MPVTKLRNKTISISQNDNELLEQKMDIAIQMGVYAKSNVVSIFIECPECRGKLNLFDMFKCFYCHFYFCANCAKKHFS